MDYLKIWIARLKEIVKRVIVIEILKKLKWIYNWQFNVYNSNYHNNITRNIFLIVSNGGN